jgi:hypothetical protein
MRAWSVVMLVMLVVGCTQAPVEEGTPMSQIAQKRAQFVEKTLTAELGHLSEGDRSALAHLVEAADAMQEIFALQAWADREAMDAEVAALDGPDAEAIRDYYRIMVGPWDRLEDFEPFYGDTLRPEGAGYYPADMTAEEFEGWIAEHPEDAEAFAGLHTIIRRDGDALVAIPYREAFAPQLERAAASLRAAADTTTNESLRRFLNLRADAFSSDDYFASDMAWMDLDSPLEIVIGPYETYEDSLFGYKAAFEAFLCVASPEDSAALEGFKARLPLLERSLPIPDEHKNFDRGSESPIRVADQYYVAGDARAGVQTLAFNLPNDERVREAKGSKKVLLKNVMRAKYEAILEPIAGLALPTGADAKLDFDAYFMFILFHEMSHGLGPGRITVDGRQTEVRLELRDLYSALEEAKADVLGVWDLYVLADEGDVDAGLLENLPWTYTAGLFRSARFGVTEAHGLGVVVQANYLLEAGAMAIDADGRFAPVVDRFRPAVKELATELLMIQAGGDYEAAQRFVADYGSVRPEMQAILDALEAIPVDIDPVFQLEERS